MSWNKKTLEVAVDTETLGVQKTDYPFAVSLCDDSGNNLFYEWDVDPHTRKPKVKQEDIVDIKKRCKGKHLVFHNQTFDLQKLAMVGCNLSWRFNSSDTQVLSHIIDSHANSWMRGRLKTLSEFYLKVGKEDQEELRKATTAARRIGKKLGWNIAQKNRGSKDDHTLRDYWMPKAVLQHHPEMVKDIEDYDDVTDHPWWTLLKRYANTDTERTMLLKMVFQNVIDKWDDDDKRHNIIAREQRITAILYDMHKIGLTVSPRKIRDGLKKHGGLIEEARKEAQKITKNPEFNINSSPQLQKLLFEELKFPKGKKSPSGGQSTDKDVRKDLTNWCEGNTSKKTKLNKKRIRIIDAWNQFKDSDKCFTDLKRFDRMRNGNKIYATLNQVGAETTRFSSPLHNIKKKGEEEGKVVVGLRDTFIPKKGFKWFCMDYSQLQLRIFAYVSGEKNLIEGFEQGLDAHMITATKIFNKPPNEITSLERRRAKNVNFGFIFGASPWKIEATAGVPGLWDHVIKVFPNAHEYMEDIKYQVNRYGYVTTPHGYRLYVDKAHKGVNYIVQGCEGDIVKEGMIYAEDYLSELQVEGFKGRMLFQVHDELIFEFPIMKNKKKESRIISELQRCMEQPGTDIGMVTPVTIEHTYTSFADTEEYSFAS